MLWQRDVHPVGTSFLYPPRKLQEPATSTRINLSVWDGRSLENTVSHCILVKISRPGLGVAQGTGQTAGPDVPGVNSADSGQATQSFCFSIPACPGEAHPLLSPLPDKASSFLGQPEISSGSPQSQPSTTISMWNPGLGYKAVYTRVPPATPPTHWCLLHQSAQSHHLSVMPAPGSGLWG